MRRSCSPFPLVSEEEAAVALHTLETAAAPEPSNADMQMRWAGALSRIAVCSQMSTIGWILFTMTTGKRSVLT